MHILMPEYSKSTSISLVCWFILCPQWISITRRNCSILKKKKPKNQETGSNTRLIYHRPRLNDHCFAKSLWKIEVFLRLTFKVFSLLEHLKVLDQNPIMQDTLQTVCKKMVFSSKNLKSKGEITVNKSRRAVKSMKPWVNIRNCKSRE